MPLPHPKLQFTNTSVDAASYVATNFIEGGQLHPVFKKWDLQLGIATQAILYTVWSTNSDGSSPFATLGLNAGGTLSIGNLWAFTMMAKASTFVNFQFSATTTVKLFYVQEIYDW